MFNAKQFQDLILAPALNALQMYSEPAVTLMLGTMATESKGGTYLSQINGPAIGIFEMEPRTHDDLWNVYLSMNPIITHRLMQLCRFAMKPTAADLLTNLMYATAMARIHYYRVKAPIPTELPLIAQYYKTYYNMNGDGSPEKFMSDYNRFMNIKVK